MWVGITIFIVCLVLGMASAWLRFYETYIILYAQTVTVISYSFNTDNGMMVGAAGITLG